MGLFGTAGIRGSAESTVTPALALAIGRAVGAPEKTFVVGRDGRETGSALVSAVEAGLLSAGSDVTRLGQVPTPALAYASRDRHGVMITASHNPPTDNGLKLFADGVEFDREAERAIERTLAVIESNDGESSIDGAGDTSTTPDGTNSERTVGDIGIPGPVAWDEWGRTERGNVLVSYREAVVEFVRTRFATDGGDGTDGIRVDGAGEDRCRSKPLAGVAIAVDCGTGVGALATPQVLGALGADVVAINASVDGHFPARESKPTPETVADVSAFVADGEFDLGLAHDGDADRLVVLDPSGEIVHEDTVLAIVAEWYTRESDASDPVVVTTPNASGRIDERVRAAGGRVERVKLGALHEGIAREQARGDEGTAVVFAAEPWKHIHPAFGGWIDGIVSAAVVGGLVAHAGGTDELREPVTERPYRKVSVPCPDDQKAETMATLETALPESFPESSIEQNEGIRLEFTDASWLLVRPSGTEPYVRLYAESDAVDELIDEARSVVEDAIPSRPTTE